MDIQERVIAILREHILAVLLGIGGLAFVGYGAIGMFGSTADQGILFESAQDTASGSAEQTVMVDVAGAVEKPGVYELSVDDRVKDALIAAGGMSADADRERISHEVNLAASLTDGAKLYIPFVGEQPAVAGASDTREAGQGSINLNTASESDLDTLPGIGPATATKIIENRPYQSIEDLLEKKAVGQSVFEKIKDQVTVY